MNAIFVAALLAGLSYWLGSRLALDPVLLAAWKSAGVALLAFWAASRARNTDGWLLAAVMALGATGDVLIELAGLQAGAAAFLAGHIVAITLYLRNRDAERGWRPLFAIPMVIAVAALLPADPAAMPPVALYSLGLATMAACAAMSRFNIAAIGAWLFVASDLLIFARLGPLAGSIIPDLLVWPLYFGGQAMIAWDVSRRASAPAPQPRAEPAAARSPR
ncbi:lysoplasmalogenase family protein [Sphingomonas tabacisoli]|uniref:Lysoplasmalogenase family protein n=1 Tax=Sphingomonas tabacisoli TaxID=2249466 RepID=A0ABW4I0Q0_9SPHN